MNNSAVNPAQWKLFFGLSRTPHGLLDMATPAMGALLCLGHFPAISTIVVGLITAFAGYTAVYALNDLVDAGVDEERLSVKDETKQLFHVDEILVPHPVAQGILPFKKGLAWCLFWAAVALAGAYWLNPFCALLFLIAAVMEALYCKLLRVSHLKVVPSVIVKSIGGLAGVYAVNPDPSLGLVAVLFLWLAAWEVGGQNVANDIVDMEDDARVAAKTTATVKGLSEAVFILVASVSMAVFGGVAVYWVAAPGISWVYPIVAAVLGWELLLKPARRVYRSPGPEAAASLFNKASYMPVAHLVLVVISILLAYGPKPMP
ncbi:UbiA family prenyltransferase [Thermodesulfobacteriota bacterium]